MAISTRATEITLATGGRAVILPTAVKDVVTIRGSIIGGPSAVSRNLEVAADIAASILDAGAGKLSKEAFRSGLASLGAELSFSTQGTRLTWSASCFPEDVGYVIARIGDALFAPHLPPADFAAQKTRVAAALDEAMGDTHGQAEDALSRLVYPSTHPNYSRTIPEYKKLLEATTLSDVKNVVKQYGTSHLAMSVVGDVQVKPVREAIEKAFGKTGKGIERPMTKPITPVTRPDTKTERVHIADKANVDVTMGCAVGLSVDDPHFLPLTIVLYMLGSGDFNSHLMVTVRSRDGLTYGCTAQLLGMKDKLDGYLQIWGTFAPEFLMRGTEALQRETKLFLDDPGYGRTFG
jgi:zinc protease